VRSGKSLTFMFCEPQQPRLGSIHPSTHRPRSLPAHGPNVPCSLPSPLMSISKEDELADLFGDVLRIVGSPEEGKSSVHFYSPNDPLTLPLTQRKVS